MKVAARQLIGERLASILNFSSKVNVWMGRGENDGVFMT